MNDNTDRLLSLLEEYEREGAAVITEEMYTLTIEVLEELTVARRILDWIARNPGAHPANTHAEAKAFMEIFHPEES